MNFPAQGLRVSALLLSAALAAPVFAHDQKHEMAGMATPAEAFGQPGVAKNVTRTIAIAMTDAMRFNPDSLTFQRGETVRLRIANTGKLEHEFVLGTQAEIDEHAKLMRQMPGMVHADASSARVKPGQSADIVWQFSRTGKFLYACLIPGHREAGMSGRVTVTEPAKR